MSPAVPAVSIDRLALRVSGLDEQAARVLARLVAEGLAPGLLRSSPGAGLDHLELEVPATPADPDLMAQRIVAAIERGLER